MNDDRQAQLEKQVAGLTAEVASLKRIITIGFIAFGILLVVALTAPGMTITVAAVGLVFWAIFYIEATFWRVLSGRSARKRKPHIA